MSIGNTKDKGNNYGNNFPYQLRNLQLLGGINDLGSAANATLLNILAAIQGGQNFSTSLVEDSTGAVFTEVRVWNGTSFDPPIYYNADGTVGTPIPPITYINPDFHLAQMVVLLTAIEAETANLNPQTRTHNTVNATGAGTVPTSLRGSVMNVGNTAGTWNGKSLPAGVSIPWDAVGSRDTYAPISYDATGTTFIIEYTT